MVRREKRGSSCSDGRKTHRPVFGWFIVSGGEGFRRSIVLRLDRATEIENWPTMGITWSITSSADGFAPPILSTVGLNLKTKRLIGNHEFPRRKSPEGGVCDEPSLFVGLIPIAMARYHGENALYALLDKDWLCFLIR